MNTEGQITIRQWFALPKTERHRRIAEFRVADEALQYYSPATGRPYRDDDPGYVELNGRVADLKPTVPWWVRSPALPETSLGRAGFVLAVVLVIVAAIALSGCQGSWTPPPTCPAGQHAARAHSHQGNVWQCVRDGAR